MSPTQKREIVDHETVASSIAASTPGRLRTLIVGAGVAGLTLAALLCQRGEAPVVVEREEALADRGYMLGLYPLGARVLHGLGLHEAFEARSVPMRRYRIGSGRGEVVRTYSLERVTRRYGAIRGISRGQLIDLFREGTGDLPVHLGTTVERLGQPDDEVNVTFSDGSSSRFDLVVAADGLHSATRDLVLDDGDYSYRDTGWGGWVFWADAERAPRDTYTEYWGARHFLGLYPTRDRLGVFAGGPLSRVENLRLAGLAAQMTDALDRPVPALRDAQGRAADDSFFWKFHDCRARHWRKGRVVLLGDAATGFLPTAGVGASMAMESAAALGDVLSRTGPRRIEQALARYEKRHRRRVEKAQDSSRQMGRMMFVESQPLAWARNRLVRFYTVEQLVKDVATIMDEPA